MEYEKKWKVVEDSLTKSYIEMWQNFDIAGKDKLPWCIHQIFDKLKTRPRILLQYSTLGKKYIPDGDKALSDTRVADFNNVLGLTIYGIYKDYSLKDSDKKYCLKSTLFHELLHYAIYHGDKSSFNIRNIKHIGKYKTHIDNFWADEGIIEDCELKLFSCSYEFYFKRRYKHYDNGAREYTLDEDDCVACKLYKEEPKASITNISNISSNEDCYSPVIFGGGSPDDFGMGLGGDSPDDNYSFSDGMVRVFDLAPEAVVFTRGYWQEALKLYGGLEFDGDNTAEKLFEATPFLVLPSGALVGKENDSAFKILLEQYVNLGGTIVVFAQQQGRHIHDVVPVPEGESLAAYGWREDQSCVNGAIYFDSVHPVMSSSVSQGLSAAVDGYFSEYPSTSSVFLKRTKNNEAALISYPYGNGTVILTSLYTDWGYAYSQATSAELKLVRDLITWAQNPRLPLPSYDPVTTPNLNFPQDCGSWPCVGLCERIG